MKRPLVLTCMTFVYLLTAGMAVHGECITTTAEHLLNGPGELVFRGRVVDITRTARLGYRATFAVDRVWKGIVSKQFAVYVWEMAPETEGFKLNGLYLVVARRITTPDDKASGLLMPIPLLSRPSRALVRLNSRRRQFAT